MLEAETTSTARDSGEQEVSSARGPKSGPALATCAWPRIRAEVRLDARAEIAPIRTGSALRAARIDLVLDAWERREDIRFTTAERDLLHLRADGLTLLQIATARRRTLVTVRTQSKALVVKTRDHSLAITVIRLLGEAASLP